MVVQWINFGILLWLLKKLLFGPVTRLLDKRANDIAQLKSDSEEDRKKAADTLDEANARLTKARKESLDTIASSRLEGFKQRESIIAQARDDAEGLMRKARSEMELEVEQAKDELRKSTVDLSLQIAERIIKRNLKSDDQKEMAQRFLVDIEKKP